MKRDLVVAMLIVAVTAIMWYGRCPAPTVHPRVEKYPRIIKHSPVESPTGSMTHKRPEPHLQMSNSYSAEFVYRHIELHGWHLSYTYAAQTRQEYQNDLKQMAHYRQDDLRTVHAELTDDEVAELIRVVQRSGFLRLTQKVYGERQRRYYPYTLSVRLDNVRRQVSYHSRPDAEPCPKAFTEVEGALKGLVGRKFHTECE